MKQKRVFPEGSLRNLARDTRVKATEPFGDSKNPFRQSLIGEKNITEKRRNKTYERQNVRNDKTIKSTSEKKNKPTNTETSDERTPNSFRKKGKLVSHMGKLRRDVIENGPAMDPRGAKIESDRGR